MLPIDVIDRSFSGNAAPLPVRDKDPSVKIEFRFMSSIKGEVERIIKEGSFNFRTASDFYRRAAWNQLLLLKELSPKMKKRMRWTQLWIETIEQSEERRQHGDMIAYLDKEVDALKRAGDTAGAKKLVFELVNLVANSGPGDTTWKRKAMLHIRNKHAELLTAPNGQQKGSQKPA